MTPPRVDVIVPCYNYGRYLRQCVASVLGDDARPVRVLVIDDASTDGSAIVARRLAREDLRIETRVHKTNRGHIATYNEGLAWARSDYLLILSADDLLAPGALSRAVALMEAHPDVGFVYGSAVRFPGAPPVLPETADGWSFSITRGPDFIRRLCERPVNPVETATAVVRTKVQHAVGGYRPQFPHSGDLEMWLRCAAHGDVGVIDAIQALVRVHGENMHHGYAGADDLSQRRHVFEHFFTRPGAPIAYAPQLRTLAMRRLAEDAVLNAEHAFDRGRPYEGILRVAREISPWAMLCARWWKLAAKRMLRRLGFQRPAYA